MKKHALAWIILFAALGGAAPAVEPLNILLLYADDWRHDTLGVAGNPVVKTPNIDRLAGEGIRFRSNYVTTSVCGVSRASLFTGQWMSRHGQRNFKMFRTPWDKTYPALLRANGYYVGHVGKWHNGPRLAQEHRFDFYESNSGRHWHYDEQSVHIHVTKLNEYHADNFLRTRPKDRPFCLTVAFFAPHAEDESPRQYLTQPESKELYTDVDIPVPSNATEESWQRLPEFFTTWNAGRRRWLWRFDTPEKYQAMMKKYYRMVTEVDSACGRLIKTLEELGLRERTLVIFTTDNGYYHGEHGLADKWYPHEESIRVPLIIDDPRMAKDKRGTVNDDMTLSVDLAPTLVAAAGVAAPNSMQGRDMAPLYLGKDKPDWRTEFFYEHPTLIEREFIPASEALVRKDWKYFYWPEHKVEQLFDVKNDPREENDLAGNPAQTERLAQMRKRFNELKAAVRKEGRVHP